jgi:alkylation response protein AidB-like acyl-CoA dehydrogenase
MNFDFSPEQEQFRDQVRRFLQKSDGLTEGRSMLNGKIRDFSATIWQGLAELGVQAAAIPEAHAGLGLGMLELCVAAHEIGRVLAPVPFLSSVGVCAEAIRRFGSAQQKSTWLPGLANGSIIGTWGAAGDDRGAPMQGSRLNAGKLVGAKQPVLDGMVAGVMIVVTANPQDAPTLMLCDLEQAAVTRQLVKTVDPTRPAARIHFDSADAESLPGGDAGAWQMLLDQAAVLLAFEQLGAAETALAMACDYAHDRVAFGRKIGSFQAVKHRLADMYAKIELARCHCYYGAWAISTEAPEAPLAAAGARCSATDALEFAAQESIQLHGGIGVTWESKCHQFYRRSRMSALILGSRFEWQDRLVDELERQLRRSEH